jgi:hypothetical protein
MGRSYESAYRSELIRLIALFAEGTPRMTCVKSETEDLCTR